MNQILALGRIFTIQKVLFVHSFYLQNVQSNASLSRVKNQTTGEINFSKGALSQISLSRESFSQHRTLLVFPSFSTFSFCDPSLPLSGCHFYEPRCGGILSSDFLGL